MQSSASSILACFHKTERLYANASQVLLVVLHSKWVVVHTAMFSLRPGQPESVDVCIEKREV